MHEGLGSIPSTTKKKIKAGSWGLTHVILATQEDHGSKPARANCL
jgi:hypothetical protein